MDIFKTNKMFFILVGVLLIILVGSTVYWWIEKAHTAKAKAEMESKRDALVQLYSSEPTTEHVKLLQAVQDNANQTYKEIIKSLINWNDYRSEAAGVADIVSFIRDDVGYAAINESTVRKWITDKKLKTFQAPDGSDYVLRPDLEAFINDVKKGVYIEYIPKELQDALLNATTKAYVSETPTTFYGRLKDLQRQIKAFAQYKETTIGQQAELLSFEKYLRDNKPPTNTEPLMPLIKQRNAVRDIMYLLIESGVFEIKSIEYIGDQSREKRSDIYVGRDFEVSFTSTYPAIARFMNMILDPRKKEMVTSPGVTELLPRNLYIVTDILYKSEEAETEAKRLAEFNAKKKEKEDYEKMKKSGGTGTVYNPYVTPGGMRNPGPKAPGSDPYEEWHKKMEKDRAKAKEKELVGRMPEHSIINVVMTITFIDLVGEVTGEVSAAGTAAVSGGKK